MSATLDRDGALPENDEGEDDEDWDDDDDFETDTRGLASHPKRRPAPPLSAPQKRTRIDEPSMPPPRQIPHQSQNTNQQLAAPASSMLRPGDIDFVALSQRSREATAAARKTAEPQTRTPWSENDVQTLIRAVSKYYAKWSIIETLAREGTLPFERLRNQQALRDKARLVKQDLLK